MNILSASPTLQVADLLKAIAFYCDHLGFEKEFVFGEPPFYASVKKNASAFHLCSSEEGAGRLGKASVYVTCDEVDSYHDDLQQKGVKVTSALATQPYGMRDFQIQDPDGNLICFGQLMES